MRARVQRLDPRGEGSRWHGHRDLQLWERRRTCPAVMGAALECRVRECFVSSSRWGATGRV